MKPKEFTYDQLSAEQREQVATQYSADALVGNDPRDYIYEAKRNGFVVCRHRMTELERRQMTVK